MHKKVASALVVVAFVLAIGFTLLLETIPAQTGETFVGLARTVEDASLQEDWDRAYAAQQEMHRIWKERQWLILLNYAEAEISSFEITLARLEGAVLAKDKGTAVGEARAAIELWAVITRFIPKP